MQKSKNLPYYAVIFTANTKSPDAEYSEYSTLLREKAEKIDGFLGIDTAGDGFEITVSYWRDLESIQAWKKDLDHSYAKVKGKEKWYESYRVRISKVEMEYGL